MMRVEVFKTNVEDADQAQTLLDHIHANFDRWSANFDLDDCDRILRVATTDGFIDTHQVVRLLDDFGFRAEVLADEVPNFFNSDLVL